MSPQTKAQTKARAGGIIRTALDNTWQTPERILERVRVYFAGPIPFDPASARHNPTHATRFCAGPPGTLFAADDLSTHNGLEVPWNWRWFCNPPYGRELRAWLMKMASEAAHARDDPVTGESVQRAGIALLPCARFEQAYLTDTLAAANAVCFIRGRVAFVSSIDGAEVPGNPYASMLVGFNVQRRAFGDAFAPLGRCLSLTPLGSDDLA